MAIMIKTFWKDLDFESLNILLLLLICNSVEVRVTWEEGSGGSENLKKKILMKL